MTLTRFPYIKAINNPDILYATTDLSILATAEVGTCIIATSAGTLRPLFVRHPETTRQLDLPPARSQTNMAQVGEGTGKTTTSDLESVRGAIKHTENANENFTE